KAYNTSLTPNPSSLRPHCLARERLHLWIPTSSRNARDKQGNIVPLLPSDLQRIRDTLIHAYAEATRETYGSGLLTFHVYCDSKMIPEHQRAPVSNILISSFITSMAGHYSAKTIVNYISGVRAWHILHGLTWSLNDMETDALLKAAISLAPASTKRSKREPYTIDMITAIRDQLNLADPLDAAVFACLTTAFFATARAGEFTIPRLDTFDPAKHVKPSNVSDTQDRQNLRMKTFFLPRTKSALEGEEVSWAKQTGPSDPEEAFANHLRVNDPPQNNALFAYRHNDSYRPLTKTKFLQRLTSATKAAGRQPVSGHGIRIGSTLEYLLRNIPFDVVKVKGRWSSDAFLAYLRRHAQILAPYMQATPELQEQFLRHTVNLPPVR
ncbi:hypothetical protein P692DRAFT_20754005, partial [Suillus brevipes Sb2]